MHENTIHRLHFFLSNEIFFLVFIRKCVYSKHENYDAQKTIFLTIFLFKRKRVYSKQLVVITEYSRDKYSIRIQMFILFPHSNIYIRKINTTETFIQRRINFYNLLTIYWDSLQSFLFVHKS